jgi:hypothetical protein
VTQVVEHLPSKCEVLNSNPRTTNNNNSKFRNTEALISREQIPVKIEGDI